MKNSITIKDTINILENCDNVTIITHKNPDGDTLGAGFALMYVLRSMGKKANVINNKPLPDRYRFLYSDYKPMEFEEKFVIAVDTADVKLIGSSLSEYYDEKCVNLNIDHHISNTFFAEKTIVDSESSAACELLYFIFKEMEVKMTNQIAMCLYTGIATDTGCFKFQNTTSRTHIVASELMKFDVKFAKINRLMFDIKSKGRVVVEQTVNKNMEFFYDDKCSMITVTNQLIKSSGLDNAEFEGLTSITLQVEGVKIGILIKQKSEDSYKVSVRTTDDVDACEFCKQFGGGGHIRAAGCELQGTLKQVKQRLLLAVEGALNINERDYSSK